MDEAGAVATGAARLVDEAGAVTAGAVRVLDGAGRATGAAEVLLADVTAATGAATAVVAQAEAAAAEAARLLAGYAPTLDKAAPLAARFVNDLTPDEVTSAIKMVDELPRLREHLVNDVMPLLGKLDQVGPDLHNLLAVTQDLHLAIVGLPGLKMLRRRGEERVAEDEDRSKRP
jgi:ABC-type transporter Mla subunit MlaD